MKRLIALLYLLSAGCSTAPVADLLDYFSPGHLRPETTAPYGGVCVPRPVGGAVANPPGPAAPFGAAPVPPASPLAPAPLGPTPPPAPSPVGAAPPPFGPVVNAPNNAAAPSHLGAPTPLLTGAPPSANSANPAGSPSQR
jgi:hypothetical protein